MPNTITLSESTLDMLVQALTALPYVEVQPIFEQLGKDLEAQQNPEPKIIY